LTIQNHLQLSSVDVGSSYDTITIRGHGHWLCKVQKLQAVQVSKRSGESLSQESIEIVRSAGHGRRQACE
jgi:hypothetical protein